MLRSLPVRSTIRNATTVLRSSSSRTTSPCRPVARTARSVSSPGPPQADTCWGRSRLRKARSAPTSTCTAERRGIGRWCHPGAARPRHSGSAESQAQTDPRRAIRVRRTVDAGGRLRDRVLIGRPAAAILRTSAGNERMRSWHSSRRSTVSVAAAGFPNRVSIPNPASLRVPSAGAPSPSPAGSVSSRHGWSRQGPRSRLRPPSASGW